MRYLYLARLWSGFSFAQTIDDPLLSKDWEAQKQWIDSVYAQMSTDEKIGQLFMVMAFSEQGKTLVLLRISTSCSSKKLIKSLNS